MNWSDVDVAMHFAKLEAWEVQEQEQEQEKAQKEVADPGLEKDLQGKCIRYCRGRGWPVFHDWSRGKNSAGWPDLFIFAEGRVILVELKAAGGRLSPDQVTLRHMLNHLGHKVEVCRSFKAFVEIVEGAKLKGGKCRQHA